MLPLTVQRVCRLGIQFCLEAMLATGSTVARHASLHRRLDVISSPTVLTQHAAPLKFFLEATKRAIYGFVGLYGYANHALNLDIGETYLRWTSSLNEPLFLAFLEENNQHRHTIGCNLLGTNQAVVVQPSVINDVTDVVLACRIIFF